jgi:small subunit ribosomal protein S21
MDETEGRSFNQYDRRPRDRDRELRPLEVEVFGDNIEKAIRVLKREMGKEGVLKMLKQKRYYEKPSEAKKRKQREAVRRNRRTLRRNNSS